MKCFENIAKEDGGDSRGSSNKHKKQRILVILKKIKAKRSGRRASGQKAGIWEFKKKINHKFL